MNFQSEVYSLQFKQRQKQSEIEYDLSKNYLTLIGAFYLKDKNKNQLENILININNNYEDLICSKLISTTLSNENSEYFEFQALFKKDITDYVKLLYLLVELYNKLDKLYIGLGSGDISTEIKEKALGMDGTAFYNAREALQNSFESEIKINLFSNKKIVDQNLSLILSLLVEFTSKWTNQQKKAIKY
ncbi:MAG: SatD family protein [Halanaerobiales bacterium]|nr:SatD family protein [Halanaerobiales bacterium]